MAITKIRKTRTALILSAIVLVVSLIFPLSSLLELKSIDLRFLLRGPRSHTAPVVIVAIDDQSFEVLDRRWPWPRSYFASALDVLRSEGAEVAVLDIMLGERGFIEENDLLLETALLDDDGMRVVIPTKFGTKLGDGYSIEYLDSPLPRFEEAAFSTGFVNLAVDADGFVRRIILSGEVSGAKRYAIFVEAVAAFEGTTPESLLSGDGAVDALRIPTSNDGSFPINYSGSAYPVVSFHQVLDGTYPDDFFQGKIVLIGAMYKESHDLFPGPYLGGEGYYGVEIFAEAIDTVFSGKTFTGARWYVNLLLLTALILLTNIIVIRFKPIYGIGAAFVILTAYLLFNQYQFSNIGRIYDLFDPLFAVTVSWVGSLAYQYFAVDKERKNVRATFSRFVAPAVVERILESPNGVELGGETREVTIFFSDIRGFTPLSTRYQPHEIVEMLNTYFTEMTDVILRYGGTLNKFIGDAIMAFFGAPLPLDDSAERTVRASVEMLEKLRALNEQRMESNDEPIGVGMGVHRGEVLVGNIGSPRQMEYTIIGDAVNVCSRIESLTRPLNADLLISEEIYNQVADIVDVKVHPPASIKGKGEKIQVYEVIGLKESH